MIPITDRISASAVVRAELRATELAAAPTAPTPATAHRNRASDWPVPARPEWFRSVDQISGSMHDLAREHPDLVRLEDIGDSTETVMGQAQRDLWALRIGKSVGTGQPKLVVLAGVHAREAANPQHVFDAVADLVKGYGTDKQATELLDSREIIVVPLVNPDGRMAVDHGLDTRDPAFAWQRKNRSTPGGVDINRNFDFKWGTVGRNLTDPASNNYAGAKPASESETQAVQALVERERPNLLLDVHSSGEVVLHPFGHTSNPAPRDAELRALAASFAKRVGYDVEASHESHPDSGTSKDWAYGKLGIPALTIETGQLYIPEQKEFDASSAIVRNLLRHGASIADAPFEHAMHGDAPTVDANTGAAHLAKASAAATANG